jgi:Sodium:dicarboxylate symporter family
MGTLASLSEIRVSAKTPLYATLWVQILIAIILAIALGYFNSSRAIAMKPLGEGLIELITMIVTAVIFCTVASGIAGIEDIKKVGHQHSSDFYPAVDHLRRGDFDIQRIGRRPGSRILSLWWGPLLSCPRFRSRAWR